MSNKDEEDIVFATDGNLFFSLTEYENVKLLDVRKYFKDKTTKEYKPTTKGISVGYKNYNSIKKIFELYDDKISAWLESSSEDIVQRQKKLEEERYAPIAIKAAENSWKSPAFFEVEPSGGENTVVYNSNTTFFELLTIVLEKISKNNPDEAERIKFLFDALLSSFNQAGNILDLPEKNNSFMEALSYNWGVILSNTLKGLKK